MPVYRVICRIDFGKPNFNIVDSPGLVMQLLNDMGDKYWDELRDAITSRAIVATYKDNERFIQRQLTVEPTQINFSIEEGKGIELGSLGSNETFTHLMKGVSSICENFKINELKRSGIRFFCLASCGENNPSMKPAFRNLIGKDILEPVASSIGEASDYGLSFDGEDKDKLKYHLKFGPYEIDEVQRYFEHFYEEIRADKRNLVFDLDMYEEDFALTVKPYNWSKVLIQKADKLVKGAEVALLKFM